VHSHDYRPDPPRLSRGRVETCHNTAAAEGTVANWPTPHLPPGSVPADAQEMKEGPGGEAGAFKETS